MSEQQAPSPAPLNEVVAWSQAAQAARRAVEMYPRTMHPESRRLAAETVLRAVYGAAETAGVTLPQPAYLAPDDRQMPLDIGLDPQ